MKISYYGLLGLVKKGEEPKEIGEDEEYDD